MPEYLAPGVFVEETSFRSKSIEGVSTSTTAFVGLARTGPSGDPAEKATPELLTSFADFERIHGGVNDLTVAPKTNYLAHAAQAYFNEGGARLYVVRVSAAGAALAATADLVATKTSKFKARFKGDAGNGTINVSLRATPTTPTAAENAVEGSFIRINKDTPEFALRRAGKWKDAANPANDKDISAVTESIDLITVDVVTTDKDGYRAEYPDLGIDPGHKRYIGSILTPTPTQRDDALERRFAFEAGNDVSGSDLLTLFTNTKEFKVGSGTGSVAGADALPTAQDWKDALNLLAGLDEISIVAAPGSTEMGTTADAIQLALIAHAETRRSYRIAVLDVPKGRSVSEAQAHKAKIDSKYGGLYYPWVVAPNPIFDPNHPKDEAELTLPPSGFVAGIYARNDIERGVHKAPANEVVRSALRFERLVNNGEQEVLNPLGVNCLRYFAGRGHRVWGARTTSSDPEWKYVNVRRYFNYLEHSIDRGTQWAVFEPNGERLWANVRETVTAFLYNEWVNGALLGEKPEQAFFVRCDRSTMTQNDLDNGRLVCLIGVAVIKPAEFVIFRIGQKTADART
jgi:uncharacterized protein